MVPFNNPEKCNEYKSKRGHNNVKKANSQFKEFLFVYKEQNFVVNMKFIQCFFKDIN